MEKPFEKRIVVNATALDSSGALSILKQFIENIPLDNQKWLIFTSPKVSLIPNNPNVSIEHIIGVKSLYKRLLWDAFGLRNWLKKNHIEPEISISLQNTGFRTRKNIPKFIYYHQSIPFSPFSWNPFKKSERTLWFYKHIYPFFVKLFLDKSTKVFVQLDFIKEGFAKLFKHPKGNITVCSPNTVITQKKRYNGSEINHLTLFYPATKHFYKNHQVIINALQYIDDDISIFFTTDASNKSKRNKSKRNKSKTNNRIICLGILPYDRVCEMYETCDALLFPSYIETYGLPLIEAALIGMPIIAADLPYAKEVLNGYEGVTFVKHDDAFAWAEAIKKLKKKKRYKPIDISNRPGWIELFESIKTSI